jgi:hypothetical protein
VVLRERTHYARHERVSVILERRVQLLNDAVKVGNGEQEWVQAAAKSGVGHREEVANPEAIDRVLNDAGAAGIFGADVIGRSPP